MTMKYNRRPPAPAQYRRFSIQQQQQQQQGPLTIRYKTESSQVISSNPTPTSVPSSTPPPPTKSDNPSCNNNNNVKDLPSLLSSSSSCLSSSSSSSPSFVPAYDALSSSGLGSVQMIQKLKTRESFMEMWQTNNNSNVHHHHHNDNITTSHRYTTFRFSMPNIIINNDYNNFEKKIIQTKKLQLLVQFQKLYYFKYYNY